MKEGRVPGRVTHLWTIGIDGRSPEDLVRLLQEYKIERVVDVRGMPVTDHPRLSQAGLSKLLGEAGLAYDLRRELGCPVALEKAFAKHGDRAAFAEGYAAALPKLAVGALAKTAEGQRVCLLGQRRDPHACHRGVLAQRLAAYGFETRHVL